MAKARVARCFYDQRDGNRIYREVESFEGEPERVAELASRGLLADAEVDVAAKPKAKPKAKAAAKPKAKPKAAKSPKAKR